MRRKTNVDENENKQQKKNFCVYLKRKFRVVLWKFVNAYFFVSCSLIVDWTNHCSLIVINIIILCFFLSHLNKRMIGIFAEIDAEIA